MSARSSAIGRWLVAASLLLLAANLRPLFPSTAVLLPDIRLGLGLSAAAAGYLTTLPVLCMGLFAPLAPRCAQRIGVERTLLLVLLMITVGTALRGVLDTTGLFLGTALGGAGIALGNVLLPSLVKRDFSDRVALMTGLYTMSLVGGAALAAAGTLPLAHHLPGGWAGGLAIWAIPALLALLAWAPVAWRAGTRQAGASRHILPVRGLRRDRLAWAVTLFMGLQSALAYCVLGWMAPMLRGRGLSGTESGLITSVSILLQVVSCLLAPMLAARGRDQRGLAVWLAATATLALIGMVLGPAWAVWPLAVAQGIGQGGLFALALMLIVLRSRDAHVAAHLSSMAQTTGYILAASGPLLIGVLYAWTGDFQAATGLIGALGLATALAGWHAGRNALVRAHTVTDDPAAASAAG
ncbi:MFS transporter [Castellaniella sp.]|uniref:MFS transporter n=1 Tax=Castellaniella sp. TaxID=1955812 RepID=UPI002AFFA477|nr:MFS transporter [Castellaniella sp.]